MIKLEVNGKRPASIAKKMGVGMLKTILPFEFVSECFNHTAPQNKSKAMQIAVGFHGEITITHKFNSTLLCILMLVFDVDCVNYNHIWYT